MRVFATKWFIRFARREDVRDQSLCQAVARAEQGSVDADLGGHLIKQRVARSGSGRSGGYRALIAYRKGQRAVLLYGFAKNERDNIDADELGGLRKLARLFVAFTEGEIGTALRSWELRELLCDEEG
jgi:hypothetical protein